MKAQSEKQPTTVKYCNIYERSCECVVHLRSKEECLTCKFRKNV